MLSIKPQALTNEFLWGSITTPRVSEGWLGWSDCLPGLNYRNVLPEQASFPSFLFNLTHTGHFYWCEIEFEIKRGTFLHSNELCWLARQKKANRQAVKQAQRERQPDVDGERGHTWTQSTYSGDSVCWNTTADRRIPWGSNTNSSSSFPDKMEKEKGGPLWKESLSVTTSCKMLVPTGLFSCIRVKGKRKIKLHLSSLFRNPSSLVVSEKLGNWALVEGIPCDILLPSQQAGVCKHPLFICGCLSRWCSGDQNTRSSCWTGS